MEDTVAIKYHKWQFHPHTQFKKYFIRTIVYICVVMEVRIIAYCFRMDFDRKTPAQNLYTNMLPCKKYL